MARNQTFCDFSVSVKPEICTTGAKTTQGSKACLTTRTSESQLKEEYKWKKNTCGGGRMREEKGSEREKREKDLAEVYFSRV